MEWKVWYHTEVKQLGGGYKKGTLRVDGGRATLETDDGTIELAPIREVGRQRVSLWLYWAHVAYGDGQDIYLGDRKLLGWAGMLGSNSKIEEALRGLQGGAAAEPPAPAG